ncbi:ATP-binding protein [Sphingomonas sp. TX0543]|uniref:sensor histidine kinase n=1 Tax=unclassified Sphingomonas TaxID=196159 RepID=UPI0010FA3DC9|nr:ATP-binding protein [Sphingomonas sp. 3P27F8]
MTASLAPNEHDLTPTWRLVVTPVVEMAVLAAFVAVLVASYFVIEHAGRPQGLIAPPLVAFLLIANLVPGIALLMLLGRRIANRRARRSLIGGEGRLHVRLVAIFSIVAAVPMLLVTIAASLLFQYGVQFWYSDRARGVFENATSLTRASYNQFLQRWEEATVTMAQDISAELSQRPIDDPRFGSFLFQQTFYRSLSEALLFSVTPKGELQTLAFVNPYDLNLARQVSAEAVTELRRGQRSVVTVTGDRIQTVTRVPGSNIFLYAARVTDPKQMTTQTRRAEDALANYHALLVKARTLQIRFNVALLVLSLLIVGVAVWIALAVADRLVRPVAELVNAARRVEGGDLAARVPNTTARDEVGTLATAFNRMTAQLEAQNTALMTANAQLDSRRMLIEAVMSGVSAGVISIGSDRKVRLINSSAEMLLGVSEAPVGKSLAAVAPELDGLLESNAREAIVQIAVNGEPRTLAVRITRDGTGPILTFDDITQQLLDQRRAAWADVARRIAHEIKNPLTPIQLAAERLQRRYGSKVEEGDTTFGRLTDTIVRQVGDLRRMVDEFSSFARMPKPVFRAESLVDIARNTMFLHEVAHAGVRFELVHEEPGPSLICDRRQIGQALTNIVKNAVEAIEAKGASGGEVRMTLSETPGRVTVSVADTGVGLPVERDRIVEPYMTTRAGGTGLGLAIVKKIVEEHFGTISFSDHDGGGTLVTMTFDTTTLASLEAGDDLASNGDLGGIVELTRNRTI